MAGENDFKYHSGQRIEALLDKLAALLRGRPQEEVKQLFDDSKAKERKESLQ